MEASARRHGSERRVRIAVGRDAHELAREGAGPTRAIAHSLDPKERVRCSHAAGHGLVVIRVPRRTRSGQLALETVPIGLVVHDEELIVVSAEENEIVAAMRDLARERERVPTAKAIAHALHAVGRSFADAVERIEEAIDVVEERLSGSLRNTEVLELLRYQKALVHHSAALHALLAIIERLPEALEISREESAELADAVIELRQAFEIADLERQTLGETMDAFASIIANNLNDVMRALTSIAIVLTPPVMIASLWGMNVALPWADHPQSFWILIAISAALSTAIALVLRAKRWL